MKREAKSVPVFSKSDKGWHGMMLYEYYIGQAILGLYSNPKMADRPMSDCVSDIFEMVDGVVEKLEQGEMK